MAIRILSSENISGSSSINGSITVNGISSTLNTGNSGTFVTNDTNNYPRITTASSDAQLGLFRSSTNVGGFYIGGSGTKFQVMNSAFATKFSVDNDGNGTFAGSITVGGGNSLISGDLYFGANADIFKQENTLKISTVEGIEYQVRSTNGSTGDHIFKSYNTAILTLNGATNAATFGGYVGIGTDTIPTYWAGYTVLQLGVDNSIFSNIDSGSGSALFIGQNIYNDGTYYRYTGVTNNEAGLVDMRSGLFKFFNAPNGTAGNIATMTQRFTVALNGNVGIGTGNDPGAKLDIIGTGASTGLTFQTTDASSNQNFFIMDGGRTGVRYYPLTVGLNSGQSVLSGARFQIATTVSNGDFVVLNDGKTGIGRTNPNYKLVVANADAEGIEFGPGYESGNNLWQNFNRTSSTYVKETHYASTYAFLTSGENTGNVGIGTAAPTNGKLDVRGRVLVNGTGTNDGFGSEQTLTIKKVLGNNGVATKVAVVGHTHALQITAVVYQTGSSGCTATGISTKYYGFGTTGFNQVTSAGSGAITNISLAYLNTNPDGTNYVLTVTPTFTSGSPPTCYLTIRGQSDVYMGIYTT